MSILGAYLFGSMARGDHDGSSDIDVLAIYRNAPNPEKRSEIHQLINSELGAQVAIAEYSEERVSEMFHQGHLFAWHLFQEAVPLTTTLLRPEAMIKFSKPANYVDGLVDAKRFTDLLVSIRAEVATAPGSLIHEGGLTYLALRNIAMSLSGTHLHRIDFTRNSPFSLSKALGTDPPCTTSEYGQLVAARHASQRGAYAPTIIQSELLELLDRSMLWADRLKGNSNART